MNKKIIKTTKFRNKGIWVSGIALGAALLVSKISYAAGTAVQIDAVDNLAATVKNLLNGNGALIIDGIIIGISGYAAGHMRSPAPMIFGIISCLIFHVAIKLLT